MVVLDTSPVIKKTGRVEVGPGQTQRDPPHRVWMVNDCLIRLKRLVTDQIPPNPALLTTLPKQTLL